MKNFLKWVSLAVVFTFVLSANAFAMKVGTVDTTTAIVQSNWGKKVIEDIKREQQRLGGDLEQKGQAFFTQMGDYEKKKDVMDKKAKERKETELKEMRTALEQQKGEADQKLNKYRTDLMNPIYLKAKELLQKIGRDQNYDLILEKPAVHYPLSEKDDLTQKLTQELDRSAPR